MKKTLFALLAAATTIGSTALAETYKLSEHAFTDLDLSPNDVLYIDAPGAYTLKSLTTEDSCTITYADSKVLFNVKGTMDISDTKVDINTTKESADQFIWYITNERSFYGIATQGLTLNGTEITFEGAKVGEQFTLIGTTEQLTGTFVGQLNSWDDLQDNQFGYRVLVDGRDALVSFKGKGTATPLPAPEPATATLGLLALAGLAARRRRS